MSYEFLQQYWCFLVCLLGALFVFLMFVQGGQTLLWSLGRTEEQRRMLLLATGRKWELTFTTLVTFGGAFFASFPLFYSTSFGGAYWVWMLILLCFVIQAVSYEFQLKKANLLGTNTYRVFLWLNGVLGPLLVGTAVGTFFFGAEFVVNKGAITDAAMPVISTWASPWHGLEAILDGRNVLLGLVVLTLTRCLAHLYFLNRIDEAEVCRRSLRMLPWEIALFLVCFLAFAACLLTATGYYATTEGVVTAREYHFLKALAEMPAVTAIFLIGVVLTLVGLLLPLVKKGCRCGIWSAGLGATLTVLALLMYSGLYGGNGVYYVSLVDVQSSLTLRNSCSSYFTLKVMSVVSLFIPFVLAYIVWAWHALEKKPIEPAEASLPH